MIKLETAHIITTLNQFNDGNKIEDFTNEIETLNKVGSTHVTFTQLSTIFDINTALYILSYCLPNDMIVMEQLIKIVAKYVIVSLDHLEKLGLEIDAKSKEYMERYSNEYNAKVAIKNGDSNYNIIMTIIEARERFVEGLDYLELNDKSKVVNCGTNDLFLIEVFSMSYDKLNK